MITRCIKILWDDPRRKNIFKIFFEYIWFLLTDPVVSKMYFSKYLYHKGVKNYNDYLLTWNIQSRCWKLNDRDYISLLDNKYLFEIFFSKTNINFVKSYAYNINSLFFINGEVIQINTFSQFLDFIQNLFLIESAKSIFIKKKEGSSGGKNIFKVTYTDIIENTQKLEKIFNEIIKSGFLFQKEIIQHKLLNNINPYSINSIRIDTFTNKNNVPQVMSAFIRLGVNQSIVDNVSSGGIYVGINVENGRLYAEGFSAFTNGRGFIFEHPDTKILFKDYKIPFFDEAMKMVINAAKYLPQVKVIGWDVAIQPDGPVIIEGNDHPGIRYSETGAKGFRNNPVFQEMLKEVQVQ